MQANCDEARDKIKKGGNEKKKTEDDDRRLAEGRWERLKKRRTRKVRRGKDTGMEQDKRAARGRKHPQPPNPPSRHRFWPVKVSLHAITAAGDRL